MDAAYLNKVNLQSKADTLFGEINFLKQVFEMVSSVLMRNPCRSHLTGDLGCKRGRPEMQRCPLGAPFPSHLDSVSLELSIPSNACAHDSWMGALEVGGRESPTVGEGEADPTSIWEMR